MDFALGEFDLMTRLGEEVEKVRNQRKMDWLRAQVFGDLSSISKELKLVLSVLEKRKRPLKPRATKYKYVQKAIENDRGTYFVSYKDAVAHRRKWEREFREH